MASHPTIVALEAKLMALAALPQVRIRWIGVNGQQVARTAIKGTQSWERNHGNMSQAAIINAVKPERPDRNRFSFPGQRLVSLAPKT